MFIIAIAFSPLVANDHRPLQFRGDLLDGKHLDAVADGELVERFLREIAEHMGLLRGVQLHGRHHRKPYALPHSHYRPGVPAGIMVCQGNHVKLKKLCKICDIIWRHGIVAAGGKA